MHIYKQIQIYNSVAEEFVDPLQEARLLRILLRQTTETHLKIPVE